MGAVVRRIHSRYIHTYTTGYIHTHTTGYIHTYTTGYIHTHTTGYIHTHTTGYIHTYTAGAFTHTQQVRTRDAPAHVPGDTPCGTVTATCTPPGAATCIC
jgi:hypothetical protein